MNAQLVHYAWLTDMYIAQVGVEVLTVNIGTSGGTSNRKLELLVAGASNLSARVQKLIARKLRAHDILIATHAPDACVA